MLRTHPQRDQPNQASSMWSASSRHPPPAASGAASSPMPALLPRSSSCAGTGAAQDNKNSARRSRLVESNRIQITIMHRFQGGEPPGWRPQRRSIWRGDDASRGLRSGVVARGRHRSIRGVVAFRQPGVHAGRSAAALHARCAAALLLGNTRRRADHRLHAPATRQSERRVPQRFRQARAIRISRQVEAGRYLPEARLCREVTARERRAHHRQRFREWLKPKRQAAGTLTGRLRSHAVISEVRATAQIKRRSHRLARTSQASAYWQTYQMPSPPLTAAPGVQPMPFCAA